VLQSALKHRVCAWRIVVASLTLCGAARAAGESDRVPKLIEISTTDPSYKVRVSAALVLGKLRDRRAVPALRKLLATDKHYTVRATAAQSLGLIGDPTAIPELERARNDAHRFVRTQAEQALALLRRAPPKPVVAVPATPAPERFYVGVGGIADKSRRAGPELTRKMREFVVRELQRTPGVSLHPDPTGKKKLRGYTLDGVITEIKRSQTREYVEISCEVSYVIGLYPKHSIIMMTSAGATVQTPRRIFRSAQERALQLEALENAVRGAHQNLVSFLQKQNSADERPQRRRSAAK
jgi:hypothetical protein